MLCLVPILGGLLIMMGQHDRSEALFYYFRLEDQVPETYLLRLIEKHISFEFVRQRLKDSYSETGRPSIDPELLLRILLVGYLYGITSERKLVEELRMHLAWRWFTGLGFDQEIPDQSTFSKNRHGRFQESNLFEQLFEQIVRQCVQVGLVQGEHLSVDGSFVEANAAKESCIPREQLGDVAQVNDTVRQYLQELEEQNPVREPVHEQDQVSTTDPDSTYATKGGTSARLGYYDNYLVDGAFVTLPVVGCAHSVYVASRKDNRLGVRAHCARVGIGNLLIAHDMSGNAEDRMEESRPFLDIKCVIAPNVHCDVALSVVGSFLLEKEHARMRFELFRQPCLLTRGAFGFYRFGSPRISAAMPTPVDLPDLTVSWSSDA
jgi:transposase